MSERRLHVGLIAPPWVPVPPSAYGGTELIVDHLARGLVAHGCDVTLFTTGDATCPVRRRWVHPQALGITGEIVAELHHVQAAYDELAGVDVIHDHTLLGPMWSAVGPGGPPVAVTVHGPFTTELARYFTRVGASATVIAISEAQRRSDPTVPVGAVIHHGIEVERFPLGAGDGGYLLFLGRMSPDKGAHRAIAVARAAGKRLLIAAKMWEPAERQYFADQVEPLLGPDAEYVGAVEGVAKLELLAGAEALVNPIQWPEPFGLVMVEALASGTPVLTFAHGAAPEIVDDGVTGFLCADIDDMAASVADVPSLDRAACRKAVETRFSVGRMVREHVALYRRMVDGAADAAPARAARS